ncbi:MAG: cbb3-type cytochrome c oxidase subunit 3 [Proteobacteria bacterium]|jgi:cbb3-type cytochrome oxidase subunit 3|nr:cbb3-type cytochrome c oxidase subunit 3 [Pseudomonadota bacterium]
MIKQLMASSVPLNMEMSGLVIFTIVFVAISLWVFRKNGKQFYAAQAQLPLTKEKEV